jgi:hypothetical protein
MIFKSLFTAGTLTGFDASGHVAEETKHAKSVWLQAFKSKIFPPLCLI